MDKLLEKEILCPYCNKSMTILVDSSVSHQEYIEDCQVCCRPIEVTASFDLEGDLIVEVRTDTE